MCRENSASHVNSFLKQLSIKLVLFLVCFRLNRIKCKKQNVHNCYIALARARFLGIGLNTHPSGLMFEQLPWELGSGKC